MRTDVIQLAQILSSMTFYTPLLYHIQEGIFGSSLLPAIKVASWKVERGSMCARRLRGHYPLWVCACVPHILLWIEVISLESIFGIGLTDHRVMVCPTLHP